MKAKDGYILGKKNRWRVTTRGSIVTFSSKRAAEEYVRFKRTKNGNPSFYDMNLALLEREKNEPSSRDYLIANYIKKIHQLFS